MRSARFRQRHLAQLVQQPAVPMTDPNHPTILIIDDDAEIRYSLARVLGSRQYQVTEAASDDLIGYMLNQRTGCMGPSGEDAEQEAEDFAALLLYRLGRLPSDRSSIVQVRLGEAFG